jgi:integrase
MPVYAVTPFMGKLIDQLVEEKKIEVATAVRYVRILMAINGDAPFKTLTFLRDKDAVFKKLDSFEKTTQKTQIAAVTSVLSIQKAPVYKALHKAYLEELHKRKAELAEARGDTMEKTAKEKENWVSWEDVLKRREDLAKEVSGMKATALTARQYETLLGYVILCLYTMVPPRRNADYQEMFIVKKLPASPDPDKNYLVLSERKFVFNKYKTAKFAGTQEVPIPDELWSALQLYLKTRPTKTETRFLVQFGGETLGAINAITRILNRVFGKKVGSSMLRHSYLSGKYGDVMTEMKADAAAMAHTIGEQKEYIRGSGTDKIELI